MTEPASKSAQVSRVGGARAGRASIVRHNREVLEKVAARLLKVESIDGEELQAIVRAARVPASAADSGSPS